MAEINTRSDKKRQKLSDILPLDAPLSVYIQASNVCNFRCNYCSQILDSQDFKKMKIERRIMDYSLFLKAIDQLEAFKGKIKTINLTGFGEPLLNKDLHKMIRECKNRGIAERIEVVTNGSLLTKEISNQLIDSGLDLLRISIQGLSEKKYKEVSKVDINFEDYIQNIKYFYNHKINTRVYIKILDVALDKNESEEDFYNLFGDYCDNIAIEHLVPVMPGVDYSYIGSFDMGMVGYKNEELQVCPRPFYMLTIDVDGSVRPCCNYKPPVIIGNIKKETVESIWNGKKMSLFRKMMLEKSRASHGVCQSCQTPIYGLHQEDNLDNDKEKVIKLFEF